MFPREDGGVVMGTLWLLRSLILGTTFSLLLLFTSTTCVVVLAVVGAAVEVVVVGAALSVTRMGFLGALEAVEEGTPLALSAALEAALAFFLGLSLICFLIQGGIFL